MFSDYSLVPKLTDITAIQVSSPNIDNTDISFQKRDYHSWHSGRFHALDNKYNTAISRYLFKLFLEKALSGKVERTACICTLTRLDSLASSCAKQLIHPKALLQMSYIKVAFLIFFKLIICKNQVIV